MLLLLNPEGLQDVLAIEVKLRFTKGFEKQPNLYMSFQEALFKLKANATLGRCSF